MTKTSAAAVQTANALRSEAAATIDDAWYCPASDHTLADRLDFAIQNISDAKQMCQTADIIKFGYKNSR